MTKHKHAEMIIAKANNTELITLSKHQITGDWAVQNDQQTTDFGECIEYFLCLPQHKEVCIHWLNGGNIQISETDGLSWDDVTLWSEGHKWDPISLFNYCDVEFRIKPQKST